MGETKIGNDDSDANAATVNSERTDVDGLEKWMPSFFEDRQQPLSWACDDFLDGVSEEFNNTQTVDWDHPENYDVYYEDSFADENKQRYRSLQQLMDQVFNSWQTLEPGLMCKVI